MTPNAWQLLVCSCAVVPTDAPPPSRHGLHLAAELGRGYECGPLLCLSSSSCLQLRIHQRAPPSTRQHRLVLVKLLEPGLNPVISLLWRVGHIQSLGCSFFFGRGCQHSHYSHYFALLVLPICAARSKRVIASRKLKVYIQLCDVQINEPNNKSRVLWKFHQSYSPEAIGLATDARHTDAHQVAPHQTRTALARKNTWQTSRTMSQTPVLNS